MRVLVFGASITQGFWDSEGGWVQRLANHFTKLELQDFGSDQPALFNLGISGDSTAGVVQRFDAETSARRWPDEAFAFVFAIGTNDAMINADGTFRNTPERYGASLERLIAKAGQFTDPKHILFVGLIPCDETRTTPVSWADIHYTNERLKLFDQTIQRVCEKYNLAYVPIFEAFQQRQEHENLLQDGLHPNDAGHQLIADLVLPAMQTLTQA